MATVDVEEMPLMVSGRDVICNPGPAQTIVPISTTDVHRICSGQVVLSLATAVKELVENSLDAGSTSIEIRLKEYGLESVEVIDNGCGVEERNFQALTLKHHTSKLSEFEDLANVSTFGFRGEALSSLCALSNLTIVTCHKNTSVATKLEFDHNGKIIRQTVCSRQIGTTVTIQNLFSTLPVRFKEFTKNVKKEFAKMLNILYAYCLISTNTRISCTNQIGKSKNVVVATRSHNNLNENICSVFGAKQSSSLIEIQQRPISKAVLDEYGLKEEAVACNIFNISGHISSCQHGLGRSSPDRQFVFVNGRPCDLPKLLKVVNEVYHVFNRHQYPFLLLNIILNKDSVDVNVTPDKRLLFIENEKVLLAVVKSSLLAIYEPQSSIVLFSQPSVSSSFNLGNYVAAGESSSRSDKDGRTTVGLSPLANLKRSFSFLSKSESGKAERETESTSTKKQPRINGFFVKEAREEGRPASRRDAAFSFDREPGLYSCSKTPPKRRCTPVDHHEASTDAAEVDFDTGGRGDSPVAANDTQDGLMPQRLGSPRNESCIISPECSNEDGGGDARVSYCLDLSMDAQRPPEDCCPSSGECRAAVSPKICQEDHVLDNPFCDSQRKTVPLNFSISELRTKLTRENERVPRECVRRFRAKIEPDENVAAEDELKREIPKEAFSKMDIVGQFNLGFIIVKLESDLFIIDQHATDEKYNFEMLQKNTVLETQKLIRPQALQLTVVNETILIDNHETFRKNGFVFQIDEKAGPGERVQLVAIPVSKNWHFGKADIEEMLFMLSDAPQGVMCRPSRIQQMFASRACRKSVMIGTALNGADMKKIVSHMESMDQPWNCPHGRPTMRHLINLDMITNPSSTSSSPPVQFLKKFVKSQGI